MAKMDDDRIVAIITEGVGQSVGFAQSKLSKERERTARYYNGELPGPPSESRSKYNSLDVFESVEEMTAVLLEVFSANKRPVVFDPIYGESDAQAQVRTDYCTQVIFSHNNGWDMLQTVIKDGLLGRAGVVKVWWEAVLKEEYYEASDLTSEALIATLHKDPSMTIDKIELDEPPGKIKRVRFCAKRDRSKVRIDPLPPEEFGIAPMAKDIETAELVFHRRPMTVSDLIKHGYPSDVIKGLQDDDKIWQATDTELIVRHEQTDDLIGNRALEGGQEARRTCMMHECYLELDIEGDGVSQLYQVMLVGTTILSKEPVDRKPFIAFVPIPIPHKFWGQNYSLLLIPTHQSRTYLTRAIVDHALATTNPRWGVVRAGVPNPRELTENKIGGVVNMNRPDSVVPLVQPPLNPFVFQTEMKLQENKEGITSVARLAQGLNKDAISKQNSQGMVQDLITASQTRQRIIARNFAERFLRGLYTLVYQLVIENEDPQKIVKYAGQWVPVDFTQWPEECKLSVSFALGYGETERELTKWGTFDKEMSSDPQLKAIYPLEKRFNVVKRMADIAGIHDITNYTIPPDQVKPPQPDPMQMAEIQVKTADAKAKEALAQATLINAQVAQQEAQFKQQDQLAKINLQTRKAVGDEQLRRDEFAHKVTVDHTELLLQQQAQENDKLTAQAEPTRGAI